MTSIERISVERLAEYISPDVRRVMLAQADRIEELEAKLAKALMLADGELDPDLTVKEYLTVQTEGPRQVNLHPCLERQVKLVVKEGVYGPFVVCKKLNGRVYVYLSKENITPNDFAQAAALFAALAMATEGVE
jgi:hypothetical protein